MNSIVERLRWPTPALKEHAKIAADLIEQQTARIAELEAERDAEREKGMVALRQSQAWQEELAALHQRIKELEAMLSSATRKADEYFTDAEDQKEQLAVLRQRIDDAQVVAFITELGALDTTDFWINLAGVKGIPLISKEDLQK